MRERAVGLVQEHRSEHRSELAPSCRSRPRSAARPRRCADGCNSPRATRAWSQATTDERERLQAPERENRELRQANEILRNVGLRSNADTQIASPNANPDHSFISSRRLANRSPRAYAASALSFSL